MKKFIRAGICALCAAVFAAFLTATAACEKSAGNDSGTTAGNNGQSAPKEEENGTMKIIVNGMEIPVKLADNQAAAQLKTKLPVKVNLADNNFEAWGPLGFSLPSSDSRVNAEPGDVMLYNGENICVFYGFNSWSYTPLGRIDMPADKLEEIFAGGAEVELAL